MQQVKNIGGSLSTQASANEIQLKEFLKQKFNLECILTHGEENKYGADAIIFNLSNYSKIIVDFKFKFKKQPQAHITQTVELVTNKTKNGKNIDHLLGWLFTDVLSDEIWWVVVDDERLLSNGATIYKCNIKWLRSYVLEQMNISSKEELMNLFYKIRDERKGHIKVNEVEYYFATDEALIYALDVNKCEKVRIPKLS